MRYEDGYYVLKSGRKMYANGGILGIGPDITDGVSEGYDGGFDPGWDDKAFTPEERQEIATEMIRRWTQWRDLDENSSR